MAHTGRALADWYRRQDRRWRRRGRRPTPEEADVVRAEARALFLDPLLRHLDEAGLGHISEIADADAPHTPRGCPFQAWSVGEALRLEREVLAPVGPDAAARAYRE